jgi:hypothetical protein
VAGDICYTKDIADTLKSNWLRFENLTGIYWEAGDVYYRKDFANTLEQLDKV